MALVTQRQAIKRLRAETNMSLEWCEQKVKAFAKVPDGSRMKLHEFHLVALIDATNRPNEQRPIVNGIRPISKKKRLRILERCV